MIPDLQYISQGENIECHLANIETVCEAGIRWIQLRLKNITEEQYLKAAIKCKAICKKYDAIFIVNDNIAVARESAADGVHLGLADENPLFARTILGEKAIIGGTANTLEDCKKRINEKVNYIGLGPFKHTTTKKVLSPILGCIGYEEILKSLKQQNQNIPIVAIGGITVTDLQELSKIGINRVAVSSYLSNKNLQKVRQNIEQMNLIFSRNKA